MLLSDFDYELPDELIARHPASERRASRLLVVDGDLQDCVFSQLPAALAPGDLLVFNDTRVIRARLRGRKDSGGQVEMLVERITNDTEVTAQVRASKTPKAGSRILFADGTEATVLGRSGDMFRLKFSVPVAEYLQQQGEVPLPPYLGRDEETADDERYQTVYARHAGAVAAPTAGLHFDDAMLEETRSVGVRHAFVTLHVGAGTFQPLRKSSVDRNQLHAERLSVGESVCEAVRDTRQRGGRVIAVGTTSVRALESASTSGEIAPCTGETSLFIQPGYAFRSVDAILTNFHLPRSSLLVLVSSFAGHERIMGAYRHAVRERYRFFSYGDAMLIFPAPK
jgi:S-adenosylmethionine:tRNA ribosyltransferase-isomerase